MHAALLDSYATASEKKHFSQDWIRVKEIIPLRYKSSTGVVLAGDAAKLSRCFRSYVKSERHSIHRVIERNINSIEVCDAQLINYFYFSCLHTPVCLSIYPSDLS